jgi:hypothetical protein
MNRRLNVRRNLSPLYLPFYDALCERLSEEWQPYSGIRSFMAQDKKYAQGREQVNGIWVVKEPGKVITNAKAGESPHNYGCATDWTIWTADGEPDWREPDDLCWKEFVDAVTAVGLRPGSEFGDVDHCELRINVPWKTIGVVFHDQGPEAAKAAIESALTPPKERVS